MSLVWRISNVVDAEPLSLRRGISGEVGATMAALGTLQAATTVSSIRKTSSQTPCVSSCRSSAGLACSSGSGTQGSGQYKGRWQSLHGKQLGRSSSDRKFGRSSSQHLKQATRGIRSKVEGGGDGWIFENDALVRTMPLFLGSVSLATILLNRSLAGIAPVAAASSAQSRSDVLALALAATVLLQGLVWKSIQPRPVISVEMEGVECFNIAPNLPVAVTQELQWVWDAIRSSTQSQALVILYGTTCILQTGLAAASEDGSAVSVNATKFLHGPLCKGLKASRKQTYLANLALYPWRFELSFLPSNAQAVILQPLGDDGVLVVASDTIRGFTSRDQAWLGTIAEKLDTSLEEWVDTPTSNLEGQVSH